MNRPEAQAGLSCMMCHSIVKVKSTMGQGDYVLEYPKLHALAASENPVMRAVHDFMVRLNPEPHRRVFLKPFMRTQVPEFCSECHKVHLDVPVNSYRWIRGFNEYDNWQGSGVSGQGARSFYYPPTPMICSDCHMPLVRSNDEGNVGWLCPFAPVPGSKYGGAIRKRRSGSDGDEQEVLAGQASKRGHFRDIAGGKERSRKRGTKGIRSKSFPRRLRWEKKRMLRCHGARRVKRVRSPHRWDA